MQPVLLLSIYVTWVTLSIFIVPLLILVLVYANICLAVWRSVSFKNKRGSRGGRSAAAILSSVPLTSTVGSPVLSTGSSLACHRLHTLANGRDLADSATVVDGSVLQLVNQSDEDINEGGGAIVGSEGGIISRLDDGISSVIDADRVIMVDIFLLINILY